MHEIPKKNYVILFFTAVTVVVVTFILMNIYNNQPKNYHSVVKEVINEIKIDDLENYLQENRDVVLYINDSTKENHQLGEQVKKLIVDNNVQQYFVYIEKNNDVSQRYNLHKHNLALVAYKDGEVAETFDEPEYTIEEIESFLVRNEVIESD